MLKTISLAGAAMALVLSSAPTFAKELKSIGVSLGSILLLVALELSAIPAIAQMTAQLLQRLRLRERSPAGIVVALGDGMASPGQRERVTG